MIIPKKSLGQNFLKDLNIAKKIISTTNIYRKNIVEIGPGLGILTNKIIDLKPNKLSLIEKDSKIYDLLKKKYFSKKINIFNADVINFNFKNYKNFKIISNLPYNISSKFLLNTLINYNNNFTEIICMIQSELADKFDYNKGKINKYKFLTQLCSQYEIKFKVSPNVFYPKPKVYSKVVRFIIKKQKIDCLKLNYFLKYFFINKRKKIKSNKYFINQISSKYLNYRYEDLKYNEVLEIYQRFKFSVS